jgi:hypothetical protein
MKLRSRYRVTLVHEVKPVRRHAGNSASNLGRSVRDPLSLHGEIVSLSSAADSCVGDPRILGPMKRKGYRNMRIVPTQSGAHLIGHKGG